jgi:GTPase SAR1 family protein
MVDTDDYSVDPSGNSMSMVRHKIVFVGDISVGKSSIIHRILENKFRDNYEVFIDILIPSLLSVLISVPKIFDLKERAFGFKYGTLQDRSDTRV